MIIIAFEIYNRWPQWYKIIEGKNWETLILGKKLNQVEENFLRKGSFLKRKKLTAKNFPEKIKAVPISLNKNSRKHFST